MFILSWTLVFKGMEGWLGFSSQVSHQTFETFGTLTAVNGSWRAINGDTSSPTHLEWTCQEAHLALRKLHHEMIGYLSNFYWIDFSIFVRSKFLGLTSRDSTPGRFCLVWPWFCVKSCCSQESHISISVELFIPRHREMDTHEITWIILNYIYTYVDIHIMIPIDTKWLCAMFYDSRIS